MVGAAPPPDDDEDDEPASTLPDPTTPAYVGTVASFVQMLYTVASERWEAVSLSEQEPDEVYPVDYEQSHAIAAQMLDSPAFQAAIAPLLRGVKGA